MQPAILALVGIGGLLIGLSVGVALTRRRFHREQREHAVAQNESVHRYLNRKCAEAGIDIGDYRVKRTYDDILNANRKMAGLLLDYDRKHVELGDTQDLGFVPTTEVPPGYTPAE